jgi:hypothetical protein
MMGAAAEIIEERRGKSYHTDWETYLAVRAAWAKLIAEANPKPEPGYFESRGYPATDSDLPPAPVRPEPVMSDAEMMADAYRVRTPEEEAEHKERLEEYEGQLKNYDEELAQWKDAIDERRNALDRGLQHFKDIYGMGEEVAVGLLPPRETK